MPTTDGGAREPNKMEVVGGIMTYKCKGMYIAT